MSKKKKKTMSPQKLWLLQGVIAGIGIYGIILGVRNQGMDAVVANAIALCMSCIGLG